MVEIERKFLVKNLDFIAQSQRNYVIKQGFLNTHPDRTVRVRVTGDQGFLTIKGKSNDSGTIRMEWETEISVADAEKLFSLCEKEMIYKTRYEVNFGNHLFEIDIFHGQNQGLIVAEIELNTEDETFDKPDWLGEEVTGDIRYYNAYLSKNPFFKPSEK